MAEGGENITAVEEVETNGTAPNGVADDASDEVFQELMDAVQLGDIPAVKKLLKKHGISVSEDTTEARVWAIYTNKKNGKYVVAEDM